jgi:endo-1,4-beta-xylanase
MKRTAIRIAWMSLLAAIVTMAAAGQAPAAKKPSLDQYGPLNWVDPNHSEPEATHYKTFHSNTINADVSYLIYLPPDYETQKATRYPVMYFLHGSGGTPRAGAPMAARQDAAIRAHRADPFIMVYVNGLAGDTMYCDSRDGKFPVETVIVKDLIPHIDASYRTIAKRESRGVEGFSMGGFGTAHLAFKYPELFGVASIEAPALLGPTLQGPVPVREWGKLFVAAMGSDMDYYKANDPFTLAVKNAEAIRDRMLIRIETHWTEGDWQSGRCEDLHKLLVEQRIPHEFYYLPNVKVHSRTLIMDAIGDTAFTYFSTQLPVWNVTKHAGGASRAKSKQ